MITLSPQDMQHELHRDLGRVGWVQLTSLPDMRPIWVNLRRVFTVIPVERLVDGHPTTCSQIFGDGVAAITVPSQAARGPGMVPQATYLSVEVTEAPDRVMSLLLQGHQS